ncbi:MAG: hypothetical protein LBB42_03775 [Coriobacteriales bacterium]|nr:hypothetical protein [Coriobacteriales bacterium]
MRKKMFDNKVAQAAPTLPRRALAVLVAVVLACSSFAVAPAAAVADTVSTTKDGIKYRIDGNGAYVIDYIGDPSKPIVVPKTLSGKNVVSVSISNRPFASTSLNVTACTELKSLIFERNKLASLNVTKNTKLTRLWCDGNKLTLLDISKNTQLVELSCKDNGITKLDVSKNVKLTELACAGNKLASLNVSKNTKLGALYCYENKLTKLDISKNTKLYYLNCEGNQLASLDVSKNTKLQRLFCVDNKLTKLEVSKNTKLNRLNCENNYISDTAALNTWLKKSGHSGEVFPQKQLPSSISGGTTSISLKVGYKATSASFTIGGNPMPTPKLTVPESAKGKVSMSKAGKLTISPGLKKGTHKVFIYLSNSVGGPATKTVTITVK